MKRFAYQNKKSKNYFEGWYFRFVGEESIGVIFALTKHSDDPHAFIQTFSNVSEQCKYQKFPVEDFFYDEKSHTVYIGENSLSNLEVHVDDIHLKMDNHLVYSEKSSMTYLENAPLECFQEVLYMKADCKGVIKGKEMIGHAYSEKTYGTNFPSKWVWIQSFNSVKGSLLSFSVGLIPVFFLRLKGFFVLLHTPLGQFRLSTTNYSSIRVGESIVMKKGKLKIELTPRMNHKVKLVGPSKNGLMNLDVFESLDSVVELKIYEKGSLVFEDTFSDVGMELMFK